MATTATPARPTLSDEQFAKLASLVKDADTVELKLTVPAGGAPHDDRLARDRPARRPDPPGLLLRHARPDARLARSRRARATRAEEGRRLGGQAPPSRAKRASRDDAEVAELWHRGRRDARGFRLLGLDEARARAAAIVRETILGGTPIKKLFSKEQRAESPAYFEPIVVLHRLVKPQRAAMLPFRNEWRLRAM